jgi:hypothetical protein
MNGPFAFVLRLAIREWVRYGHIGKQAVNAGIRGLVQMLLHYLAPM